MEAALSGRHAFCYHPLVHLARLHHPLAKSMLFFFSYARADFSPFLKRFYEDLREAVRSKSGEPNGDRVAFRDSISIEPGRPWPEAITNALRECKVFVYLHSPTYFTRDGCGREFQVIKSRLAAAGGLASELAQASCVLGCGTDN
jgi:hypothetical protein